MSRRNGGRSPGARHRSSQQRRKKAAARRRKKTSPKAWADHYTQKAKDEGFSARSAYKLEEIDKRLGVLRGVRRVLDLGCAPGSWSELVKRRRPGAAVVGIDIQLAEPFPGTFLLGDIRDQDPAVLREALGGPADLVLSDMAPHTTGARLTDHVRQLELAQLAFETACQTLAPGGTFVVKVFDGADAHAFTLDVRRRFKKAKRVRPEATRSKSVEFFFVATGFLGQAPPTEE